MSGAGGVGGTRGGQRGGPVPAPAHTDPGPAPAGGCAAPPLSGTHTPTPRGTGTSTDRAQPPPTGGSPRAIKGARGDPVLSGGGCRGRPAWRVSRVGVCWGVVCLGGKMEVSGGVGGCVPWGGCGSGGGVSDGGVCMSLGGLSSVGGAVSRGEGCPVQGAASRGLVPCPVGGWGEEGDVPFRLPCPVGGCRVPRAVSRAGGQVVSRGGLCLGWGGLVPCGAVFHGEGSVPRRGACFLWGSCLSWGCVLWGRFQLGAVSRGGLCLPGGAVSRGVPCPALRFPSGPAPRSPSRGAPRGRSVCVTSGPAGRPAMLPALRRCRPGPVLGAALGPAALPGPGTGLGLCPGPSPAWGPLLVPARGRKTRYDPPAKSKASRLKVPPPVDPEELLVVTERYRQHRLVLGALRYPPGGWWCGRRGGATWPGLGAAVGRGRVGGWL